MALFEQLAQTNFDNLSTLFSAPDRCVWFLYFHLVAIAACIPVSLSQTTRRTSFPRVSAALTFVARLAPACSTTVPSVNKSRVSFIVRREWVAMLVVGKDQLDTKRHRGDGICDVENLAVGETQV